MISLGWLAMVGCVADSGDDGEKEGVSASALAPTRIEAETMALTNLVPANGAFASGGRFTQLKAGSPTGTASFTFAGATGLYDLYAAVFDESDGQSRFTLRRGTTTLATWTNAENKPASAPSAATLQRRIVGANLTLTNGQTFSLTIARNGAEAGGFDYLELVPVTTAKGIATRPANTTCVAPARPATGALALARFGAGLTFAIPMMAAQPASDPAGDRLYIAERAGKLISIPRQDTATNADKRVEFDIDSLASALPVQDAGEGGLLGIAFDPGYATNGRLFVSYTTTNPGVTPNLRSLIARVTRNHATGTWGGYKVILGPFAQPALNHNGGGLRFGKDGLLYASFGDGGGQNDQFDNGQRHAGFFSKVIRIDVSGSGYTIPSSNPWPAGQNGFAPEAFAYGFRNPFRFTVDRLSGEIWIGDVGGSGPNAFEEVNLLVKGSNYGWPLREGPGCGPGLGTTCPSAGFRGPVFTYPHAAKAGYPITGSSITGGTIVRDESLPASVQGKYVFGDYGATSAWLVDLESKAVETVAGGAESWVSFDEDRDGHVYGATFTGKLFRLEQAAAGGTEDYPSKLSATGCFKTNGEPSASLIPYDVNTPLWSDATDKERFIALPGGTKITVGVDGDLDLPIGSVAVKTFRIGGKKVETRLMVRHDDGGWEGFTYEWNAAGTDATLLKTGKSKAVGGQTWSFPSRADCRKCHTSAAGFTLGLEIGQLNRNFLYPAGNNTNQIETWKAIGLFKGTVPLASTLTAYPMPFGAAPLANRAASYLHANCSMCHREGGTGPTFDARYSMPFGAGAGTKNMCNVVPVDSLGITGARIVAPGSPARSIILERMSRDDVRMPTIGSALIHRGGVDLVRAWIGSLSGCP